MSIGFRPKQTTRDFLEKYCKENNVSIKEALEGFITKAQQESQKPHSDIPMGTSTDLLDPSLPKETLEARKELLEACKRQELHQYIPPPCPFCAKISETEIECGKELKKGKKPLRMTTISCLTCWDRKEYIRKKVEKQKENEAEQDKKLGERSTTESGEEYVQIQGKTGPIRVLVSELPKRQKSLSVEGSNEFRGYLREWNCRKLATKFAYVKTPELKDKLPCLQDPTIICAEKIYPENPKSITCRELIANKIQIEAPELIKELATKTIATFSKPKVEGEA